MLKNHDWIDSGAFIHESYERNGMTSGKSKVEGPAYCCICGKTLQNKQRKTCSVECSGFHKTTPNKPTSDQLQQDMNELSWVAIGKKYGVSDNGARKWGKKYGLL